MAGLISSISRPLTDMKNGKDSRFHYWLRALIGCKCP